MRATVAASLVLLPSVVAQSLAAQEPAAPPPPPAPAAPALALVRTIALPGVAGRFDHFALDAASHRLFVAALGNGTLEVVDVDKGEPVRSIAGLKKPCGVLWLGSPAQVAVATGDDGALRLFDGATGAPGKQLAGLDDADNVRLDAAAGLVYVGYGAGALAVAKLPALELLRTIELKAHPESFQLEARGPRLFVNVPGAAHVAVVDRGTGKVTATWPLGAFAQNFPMALDEPHGRLFVGCRQPPAILVLDAATGARVADVAIDGDQDDLFFATAGGVHYGECGARGVERA